MAEQTPIIPPSPSASDYASERDRPLIPDHDDPFALFRIWLGEAQSAEPNDPHAMSLATVGEDGAPDVRILLLKDVTPEGFTFYTNLASAKGEQLAVNPIAALCFHWKSLRRQVRVRGEVGRVADEDADAYFTSRARASQIAAIASDQSRPLETREQYLDKVAATEADYADAAALPRPADWGGFILRPSEIEFWQDQAFRMHDRVLFKRENETSAWGRGRLYP